MSRPSRETCRRCPGRGAVARSPAPSTICGLPAGLERIRRACLDRTPGRRRPAGARARVPHRCHGSRCESARPKGPRGAARTASALRGQTWPGSAWRGAAGATPRATLRRRSASPPQRRGPGERSDPDRVSSVRRRDRDGSDQGVGPRGPLHMVPESGRGRENARASRRAVEAQQIPETSSDVACRAGDQDPRPRRWARRRVRRHGRTIRSSAPRPSRRTAGAEQRPAARVCGGNGAARAAAAEVVDVAVDGLLAIDIDLEQTGTHEGCARASAQRCGGQGTASARRSRRPIRFHVGNLVEGGEGRPVDLGPCRRRSSDGPTPAALGAACRAAGGDQGPLPTPRDRL